MLLFGNYNNGKEIKSRVVSVRISNVFKTRDGVVSNVFCFRISIFEFVGRVECGRRPECANGCARVPADRLLRSPATELRSTRLFTLSRLLWFKFYFLQFSVLNGGSDIFVLSKYFTRINDVPHLIRDVELF